MKKLITCLLLLLTAAGLLAQQNKPVVAVMPFTVGSGVSASEADAITNIFVIKLVHAGKVEVINRAALETVIKEHNFQAGDLADNEKKAKLGKALNAEFIAQGKLEKIGGSILVSVQLLSIETHEFISGAGSRFADMEEAYRKMDAIVDSLLKSIQTREKN